MIQGYEQWLIVYVDGAFTLLNPNGLVVISGSKNPKELSAHAFDHGAYAVRHDYDLRLAEDYNVRQRK